MRWNHPIPIPYMSSDSVCSVAVAKDSEHGALFLRLDAAWGEVAASWPNPKGDEAAAGYCTWTGCAEVNVRNW